MVTHRFVPGIVPERRPGPAGGRRAMNRQERTQLLCEAALELFLVAGIGATTVDEITRSAGVAKGTFYRYFSDKGQLVDALFQHTRDEILSCLTNCRNGIALAREAGELHQIYGTLAMQMSQILLAEPRLTRLYLQESRSPAKGAAAMIGALSRELRDAVVSMTEAAKERGFLRELPAGLVAVAVMGAIEALLMQHFSGFDLGTPEEGAAALISLVLDGLR